MFKALICLSALALVAAVPTYKLSSQSPGMSAAFDSWKETHGKVYATPEEHARRLEIFTANSILVEKHNAGDNTWSMALNQFADMTPNEFVEQQKLWPSTLGTDQSSAPGRHINSNTSLPSSVDWRTKGLVNAVKNQEQCGSCWAFSTVVSYEGQVAKQSGNLISFSEQNLVDCVKGQTVPGESQSCCDGCQGGLMDYAFAYMMSKQGGKDDTESSYRYTAADGTCKFSTSSTRGAVPVTKYHDIAKGNENDLKDAVANVGPISVAVDANMGWQFYSGGVFKPLLCNKEKLNHGVAVVGYGSEGSDNYWIIRNSWGATWGESGYMRMKAGSNTCGVANSAVYPVL